MTTDTKLDLDVLERIAKRGSTITPSDTLALIARIRELESANAVIAMENDRMAASVAPDGYVLVPAQPSIAMCINGAAATDNEINGHAAAQVYTAMLLAAAPATQPTETK